MTKLNFLSTASFMLAGALVGLTLSACDFGPKMIGNETDGAVECQDGETKPADDGCNTCSCIDGEWGCTEKACEGQTTVPAMCQDGESKPADDGCNTCSCIDGQWGCTEKGCEGVTTSGYDPSDTDVNTSTSTTTLATDGSSTGATDTDGEPPPVIPCEGEAVPLGDITTLMAYTKSQVPPKPDNTSTSGTASGGGELDPGTILVTLSDQTFTCADPEALLQCGGHWQVTIVIPPEFQSPGTYNLLGQDVHGGAFETGDEGNQDCSFGGGSFDATLQIFSVDDNTVEGRLCHVNPFFSVPVPSLEGSFSAPRCL
ncbi:MAG: hypothetical protein H0T76_10925 [Nannocystis sp.]|nr:hypothetical protein [Nannocystis sp.]MBA3546986.1 hypothetical protein [Nannocystis sp.]